MVRSMTGFAAGSGSHGPHRWTWELRSVNGKGLDLRLRIPDWIDGLEPALRAAMGQAAARGNVTLGLRITRAEGEGVPGVNMTQLAAVLSAAQIIEAQAKGAGLTLAPVRATDIMGQRGVMEQVVEPDDTGPLRAALLADLPQVIEAFRAMRAGEGAALGAVLSAQLDQIETLVETARAQAQDRAEQRRRSMAQALARVMDNVDAADPQRIAQELALIAVKADITEEIDRLVAHVAAARDLLGRAEPVGRRLDFLMQEFNREANTLCSKAQDSALTQTGLALKVVIDQMREQVQNVE
jgi:uncharacterized protein (TIGR00255 family)